MPSKSKQQYKQYAINTVEDACAVLKGLIVPVILDMEKFEQYSKEAQEILIKYKHAEEIPADVYDSVHDKLLYQQRELLRFIADHQTSSFSYIDVRKKFEKRGFLKRKLSTKSSETLNVIIGEASLDATWDSYLLSLSQMGLQECIDYRQHAYDDYIG